MSNKYYIGTSGWTYYNWKELFYPNEIKQAEWLQYYSSQYDTVEVNSTFYSLPRLSSLKRWQELTDHDFTFSIKAWKKITHDKKLNNCNDEVKIFFNAIQSLKEKAKVILFQLPGSFSKDITLLKDFINLLPSDYLYTFEFRNSSWWCDEVYSILQTHNIAFCIFELGKVISPKVITAKFIYIRLHGNGKPYFSCYNDLELLKWGGWIKAQKENVYVYFNNTAVQDDAIQNAKALEAMLKGNRYENYLTIG
jgi:uncharacterized protein YecE (DUF72 family)